MPNKSLAASLAGSLCLIAMTGLVSPVVAADLNSPDEEGYQAGGASPYDDPRFSDIYRQPPPPQAPTPRPYYGERPEGPPPGPYAERPDGPPPPPPDERSYRPRRYSGGDGRCLSRGEIADVLRRHGWSDFEHVVRDGPVARVQASRRNGGFYDLSVDSCTGQVLEARLLQPPAYAYAPPRRRYYGD